VRISSVEATEGGGYRQVQFERPSSREVIIHLEHSLAPNQGLAVKVFTAPIDTPSSSARQLLKVTAGSMQSCALTLGGALYGCGLPTTDGKAIEVSAGVGRNFMCGLEANAVDRRDSGILGLLGATGELMRGKVVAIVKMPTRGPTSIGASMFNACATFEVGLVAC
jgi:hypothetical protein